MSSQEYTVNYQKVLRGEFLFESTLQDQSPVYNSDILSHSSHGNNDARRSPSPNYHDGTFVSPASFSHTSTSNLFSLNGRLPVTIPFGHPDNDLNTTYQSCRTTEHSWSFAPSAYKDTATPLPIPFRVAQSAYSPGCITTALSTNTMSHTYSPLPSPSPSPFPVPQLVPACRLPNSVGHTDPEFTVSNGCTFCDIWTSNTFNERLIILNLSSREVQRQGEH